MIDHMPITLLFLGDAFGTDTRGQAVLPEGTEGKAPACFWSKCEKICMERSSAFIVSRPRSFTASPGLAT
jgi:hypothetical protein